MGEKDDAEVYRMYDLLESEIGDTLPEFDFVVRSVFEHGEPEAAIVYGIVEAAALKVWMSPRLLAAAKATFPRGEDRELIDWAEEENAALPLPKSA